MEQVIQVIPHGRQGPIDLFCLVNTMAADD